jgi:hypothetical protein
MPQQLLNGPQVGAALEKMRGEAMAQSVGRDVLGYPGDREMPLKDQMEATNREWSPKMVEK